MTKHALITGITGQDGSYLAELLLSKGYEVHGIIRRSSTFNTSRIDHLFNDLHLHYGDMTDGSSLASILEKSAPHEIYHLAAQSHVKVSFELPEYTALADGIGTLKLLEAVRIQTPYFNKPPRIYNACTSEMFGNQNNQILNEGSPFEPESPYGTAKLYSYWIACNYRKAYKMFISNGILFNHESPRRGETFITKKVTKAAARIKLGLQDKLVIGNPKATRDWGHAKDYVRAMHAMLQYEYADDWVVATGESYSVRELIEYAFQCVGIDIQWKDDGGYDTANNRLLVEIDPKYKRPNEVWHLRGSAAKANELLGWEPKYTFKGMIDEMIEYDLKEARDEISSSVRNLGT